MATALILQIIMTLMCLVGIPYIFLTFKKLWVIPQSKEYNEQRMALVRNIVVVLGFLVLMAFLLPLTIKYGG